MNQQQLDQFGKEDPVAQLTWLLERDRELKKLWKCPCGKELPTNDIWKSRFSNFILAHRAGEDPEHSSYWCSTCAMARGMRIDH